MNSEHRSCLCKGASCKHLMTKSYGGHFLHALSTLTLSPLRKASPFISLGASPQGWERLCHSSMGLSLQGPWHGHSHAIPMSAARIHSELHSLGAFSTLYRYHIPFSLHLLTDTKADSLTWPLPLVPMTHSDTSLQQADHLQERYGCTTPPSSLVFQECP